MRIKQVESELELYGIASLQKINLRKSLSTEKAAKYGFLTAEYELDYLRDMHATQPSIIAVDNGEVVGYALVANKEVGLHHDLLGDLIRTVDKVEYKGRDLETSNYVLVGQLCVAEAFRGQGIVAKLYSYFRAQLEDKFDYCVTDVAQDNPRSLKAHLNTGFTIIDQLHYGGIGWNVILWDWTEKNCMPDLV